MMIKLRLLRLKIELVSMINSKKLFCIVVLKNYIFPNRSIPIRMIFRELLNSGEIDIGDCAYAVLKEKDKKLSLKGKDGISFKK